MLAMGVGAMWLPVLSMRASTYTPSRVMKNDPIGLG
jgi:hypothetical protein